MRDKAIAWVRGKADRICDVREPWAHGTVLRSTGHPQFYDLNHVRVESPPTGDLEAVAEAALAGLDHRRLDFQDEAWAFELDGWELEPLALLRHTTGEAPRPGARVREVALDDVRDLRAAWHQEDFPGQPYEAYLDQSLAVARALGTRTFVVGDGEGFADLEARDGGAEITAIYVAREHRGSGLGTALTCAAIEAAGRPADLWITADADRRPHALYRRLGFADAHRWAQLTCWPPPSA